MFRFSFEKDVDAATSHLRLEPDWPAIMIICDKINQKDVNPKGAFAVIKRKMNSPNPHSAYYALLVLESVIKNCGTPIHDEVFTKDNCKMFSQFLEQTPHDNVRNKMLELIQTWAYAFRSSDKYQAIKDTMTILKTKGHTFPELKEADAMFAMNTAPNWADGKVCHRCRVEFTLTNRKHHCRNCGQVFCAQCTTQQCPLPKYGIEKEVRVCDGCFAQLQYPGGDKSLAHSAESDLPAEYLNSSLAQQVQSPPRKSEQELKEEEELQLALALSQSEAEVKSQKQQQQQQVYRMAQRSPSPETLSPVKEAPLEETNPDLAKYLNRSYWEQRKLNESPMAIPSAPSPMAATPQPQQLSSAVNALGVKTMDEQKLDEFAANMKMQVEIFVNRMKSDSSRGRSIANDSAVQTLFKTLTTLHSQHLSYIKDLDDKRLWYEQLQDKLAQIKDSRAALDVLRQEHAEKLRRLAEEQERQRQMQMAQKLQIMRKKKQEYLQMERQIALQRLQEQEREMQLRQEQQMAQYRMGQSVFPFMPAMSGAPAPNAQQQMVAGVYNPYGQTVTTAAGSIYNHSMNTALPGMYSHSLGMMQPPISNVMAMQQPTQMQTGMMPPQALMIDQSHYQQQQQQQQQQQLQNNQLPQNTIPATVPMSVGQPPQVEASMVRMQPQQQLDSNKLVSQSQHSMHNAQTSVHTNTNGLPQAATAVAQQQHQQQQQQEIPSNQMQQQQQSATAQSAIQIQAVNSAPAPPQNEPEPVGVKAHQEPATAELISFD